MDAARWERLQELFARAGELTGDARVELLDRECGADLELRSRIDEMLVITFDGRQVIAAELEALARHELDGARIGPYRVISRLGIGGMGSVWLAERDDESYERRVAIKVINGEVATPHMIARFRDERRILATLDHPMIVRLIDGGTTAEGAPYLVMEYVDGSAFSTHVATLPIRARVELVVRVARAVQYAHQRLIVHRDLKPSNILVAADGSPKLLDFGIAKLLDDSGVREARTRTGAALLTPEYASPEQARGDAVTVASDVYSLGAVLFAALVGFPPQSVGTSPLETLRNICEVEAARPSSTAAAALRREIAGDLDSIVLKALNKKVDHRYASMAALIDDLERYLDGRPVEARDATFSYRLRKTIVRHRGALALALLVTLALTAATVISILQAHRADARTTEAIEQNTALLRERGLQELGTGHAGRALPYLVEALKHADTGALRFALAQATRPYDDEIATRLFPAGVWNVEYSPDSKWVAVACANGRVYVIDAATGADHAVALAGNVTLEVPRFSPDGTKLLAGGGDGVVRWWDANLGGNAHELSPPLALHDAVNQRVPYVGFADDRTVIGVGGDGTVARWDLATGGRDVTPALGSTLWATPLGTSRVVLVDAGGPARVLDIASRTTLATLAHVNVNLPPGLETGRDGMLYLVTDDLVRAWRSDFTQAWELAARNVGYGGVRLDAARTRMATGGIPRVWNARTGLLETQFTGPVGMVIENSLSPDGTLAVTTGADNAFRLWDANTGVQLEVYEARVGGGVAGRARGGIVGAEIAPDDTTVVTAWSTGVSLWRHTSVSRMFAMPPETVSVTAVADPSEQLAVAGGGGNLLALYELPSGRFLKRIPVDADTVWHAEWAPDGKRFIAVGTLGFARVYDRSGAEVARWDVGAANLNSATFDPAGALVVTAGRDGAARVVRADTGASITVLKHPKAVMWGAWNLQRTLLATTCFDGKIRFWSTLDWHLVSTIDAGNIALLAASFSPDGHHLATGGHGGEADVWNVDRGVHELSLVGHSQPVPQIAYSHDGALLATASSDGTLRIWDSASGKELASFSQVPEILEVQWSRDDRRLYSASGGAGLGITEVPRETRSVEELEAFVSTHSPYRLVGSQLESSDQHTTTHDP